MREHVLDKDKYDRRPVGEKVDLHRLVPGRSWVCLGRGGRRWWTRFAGHRDEISVCVLDGGRTAVIARAHVLATWTISDEMFGCVGGAVVAV